MFLCVRELGLKVTVLTYMLKYFNLLNKVVACRLLLQQLFICLAETLKKQYICGI